MIRGSNDGDRATTNSTSQGVVTSSSDQTVTSSTSATVANFPRAQNVNVVSVLPPNRAASGGPQYVTTNQQLIAASSSPGSVMGTLRPTLATTVHQVGPQQALYTVGTSSNLARILASTHGYVQVRYGTPVATVASGSHPQTVSVSSIRSPVTNVLATSLGSGTTKAPIVLSNPIDTSRVGGAAQISSAPTVVTWMRPSTPTSPSSVNRLLPQRLTFSRELQTVRWPVVTTTTADSVTVVTSATTAVRSAANRHKRLKVEGEEPAADSSELRRSIGEYRTVEATACKQSYLEHMSELFFLQNGLNIMDYLTWKKRSNQQLMAYLRANALDSDDEEQSSSLPSSSSIAVCVPTALPLPTPVAIPCPPVTPPPPPPPAPLSLSSTTSGSASKPLAEVKVPVSGGTPVATSTTLPAAISQLVQQGKYYVPGKPQGGRHGMVFGNYQPSSSQSKIFHPFTPAGTPLSCNLSTRSSSQSSLPTSFTMAPSTKSQTPSVPVVTNEPRMAARIVPTTPSTPPPASSNVVHPVATSPQKALTTAAVSSHGNTSLVKTPRMPSFGGGSPARLQTRQHSISAVYDSTLGSQEEIVERAKQEAYVVQKVSELRKEGLWSEKRLPKVQEPPRTKAHWDYLLEEMVWLATDFAQERKWKKATAKKCAKMCQKFQQEKKLREERAEKDAEQKLKRIASVVAKEIKQFWANVEKLVEFKQQSRLEEKRKRALDHQLNFIVDQTEKYSSWLAQGMNKSVAESGHGNVVVSSRSSSPGHSRNSGSDGDFEPASEESDDEETIAKEEEIGVDADAERMELDLLQKESEAPLEDILRKLPPEILERPATPLGSEDEEEEDEEDGDREVEGDLDVAGPSSSSKILADNEFHVSSNESTTDDELTMAEQEALERDVDHARELEELKNEGEMTLEELADKYCDAYDSDFHMEGSEDSADSSDEEDDESEYDESSAESNCEESLEVGLESLVDPVKRVDPVEADCDAGGPGKEITDIVAAAESLKPKGYTYLTTQVATKVPFLLKHQLREYQHIGLDWLVTMYERKLNGILADEMGLGKTIQTIALLAHLACEKGTWGPHLIVVPTSVMLNWEMEIKKWCPAFKILTYYGNVKERKQKRQGWTKPNTFHICITSYKLVIQDHQSFRRKKWKYFILDEAQNIKNFKSQRWQLLLNFQSQRRLLLTGTPLQNSLMELWSLMHFLMPNVFHSHHDFKEWFANPVSGMIEGSHDYNRELISRLHKVLRPFLLRRLKSEVEKQLPSKFEHVVMCRLSKRQRFLYDDFMSQAKTKETLASGSFMSVINVLMQLRKVCNHPNLFESRPTVSPFRMQAICHETSSLCSRALEYNPFKVVDLFSLNLLLADLELCLTAFAAHRIKKFQTSKKLIEEIDSSPTIPPKCPPGKIKLHVRTTSTTAAQKTAASSVQTTTNSAVAPTPPVANVAGVQIKTVLPCSQPNVATASTAPPLSSGYTIVTVPAAVRTIAPAAITTSAVGHHTGYTLQLVQQQASSQGTLAVCQSGSTPVVTSTPITVQIQQTQHGPRLTVPSAQLAQIPSGFAQLVQTSTGQHILLTSNSPQTVLKPVNAVHSTSGVGQGTTSAARLTVTLSTSTGRPAVTAVDHPAVNQLRSSVPLSALGPTTTAVLSNLSKPIGRVQPLNVVTVSSPVAASVVTTPKTVVSQPMKMATRATTRADGGQDDSKADLRLTNKPSVKSLFCLEEVLERRRKHRRERLERLAKFNTRRCEACPIYGSDLIKAVTVVDDTDPVGPAWRGMGYVHCLKATSLSSHPNHYWNQTEALGAAVSTPESLLRRLHDILSRFVFLVPPVLAPNVTMHVSHPSPSRLRAEISEATLLRSALSQKVACLHPIASAMATQFPDPRLIQYDCGKLQTLDRLLRSLKTDGRRVLIFTQMTRMLDVLEQFLNYHGHIYLRLDGTTRVEQRQALMERFNADRRIFCFILSTRSGGIGVNLTGADTVIFYDSDWNPTMDAQAQDRCHRIGQTRDVHIYRLISERTVEENILKKANQKRLLGEVAIEGGNFTTAFFKKHTIKELFEMDFGAPKVDSFISVIKQEPKEEDAAATSLDLIGAMSTAQLEHALANAEEDTDVLAAKTAKAEAAAELAEFDESISYDGDSRGDDDLNKVEDELGSLISQLTPVERYAMTFLESTQEPFSLEQLKQAEEEIEAQKKDWELGRLQALREEEERRASMEDNDIPYTYAREDAYNQIYISQNTGEQMPMWAPPTPPQDEMDFYVDYSLCFLYEPNIMAESQLPPVYVKKDHKRTRLDASSVARKQKMVRKDDSVFIPRSLFDRPTAAILKMRRDIKTQKSRTGVKLTSGYKPPAVINKPIVDTHQDSPEWLIHEDWTLLQTVQTLLELPLNLVVLSPAHTPNWDLVADVVNATSRMYRSSKQCKIRYESVVIPREEGKILYDTNPKKQKKSKGIYRTKNNRPMRTSQLFIQDNNMSFTHLCHQRFEAIKAISNKRMPTLKPMLVNTSIRNPKHAAVLAETGINNEQPLTPVQVAMNRADRITREKLKSQVLTNEQLVQRQLQPPVQPVSPQVQPTPPVHSPAPVQSIIGLSPGGITTAQQLQNVIGRMVAAAPGITATPVAAAPVVPGPIRTQRGATQALVMQDMLGGVTQVRGLTSTVAPTVVSMANLVASQVQTAVGTPQRVNTTGITSLMTGTVPVQPASTSPQLTGKGLLVAQIQQIRAQSLYKQQQQQRLQQVAQQQQQQIPLHSPKVPIAVTSLLSPGVATVQVAHAQQQQQVQQRFQAVKQGVPRAMTEVEVAQLIRRQQLLQQQKAAAVAAAQVTQVQVPAQGQLSSQLLAQAQLQQQQSTSVSTGQTSLATLVKTVSTPTSLGASPSVTIPVGMAGVNINVNLPQVKAAIGTAKGTVVTQQQQLQQVKLQQQLQQRKLQQLQQQQQKAAHFAHGKAQLGTVQIMHQAAAAQTAHKVLPAGVSVQQLHQVIKQVQPQALQHLTQVSAAGTAIMTQATVVSQAQIQQALSHSVLAKSASVSTAAGHATPTLGQATVHARLIPVSQTMSNIPTSTLAQQHTTAGALKQTIQVVTATNPTQLIQSQIRTQAVGSANPNIMDVSGRQHVMIGHAAPIATTVTTMTLPPGMKVVSSATQPPQPTHVTLGIPQVGNLGGQQQPPSGSGR